MKAKRLLLTPQHLLDTRNHSCLTGMENLQQLFFSGSHKNNNKININFIKKKFSRQVKPSHTPTSVNQKPNFKSDTTIYAPALNKQGTVVQLQV